MDETVSAFQVILEELLQATHASRTTIRIDNPEKGSHVNTALVEALAPGARSIKSLTSIEQRKLATVRFLEEQRCNLIQDDLMNTEVSAPKELTQFYGVKAQMLGPLVWDNRLIGFISVHYTPSARHWSDKDIAALDEAKKTVLTRLEQTGWLK
jgi:maleate isomerase